jgi:hypothetical protein
VIVADTSVWIDFVHNRETPEAFTLAAALTNNSVLMGDLILMEVLQGFRRDEDWLRVKLALDPLPFAPMAGRDIALMAASNYRSLRAKGVTPRKTIDVLIATFCIENGHHLLHNDRDFDAMQENLGLKVI